MSFPIAGGTTVAAIFDVIVARGHQKYEFTEDLEGCRFWLYTFVNDLEEMGLIPKGSAAAAWGVMSYYWRYPQGQDVRAIQRGTFRS
jgi:hypothetical protein